MHMPENSIVFCNFYCQYCHKDYSLHTMEENSYQCPTCRNWVLCSDRYHRHSCYKLGLGSVETDMWVLYQDKLHRVIGKDGFRRTIDLEGIGTVSVGICDSISVSPYGGASTEED